MKLIDGIWHVTCPVRGDTLRFYSRNVADWYLQLCAEVKEHKARRLGRG